MGSFFTMLFAKIAAVIQWFAALFVAIFVAIWDVLTDLICWVFEGFFDIAISAANSVDISGIENSLGVFADLPPELVNVLGLVGFGQAMGIIGTALVIRFVLQLIPFVRLGS